MFAAKMKPRWISPEEYLQQEETATNRHEYFNGQKKSNPLPRG